MLEKETKKRNKDKHTDTQRVELIFVPNPLKAKMNGADSSITFEMLKVLCFSNSEKGSFFGTEI